MTGKDLIIYILANNLENEPIFKDGKFIGFVTAGEVAAKMNVGVATVYVWIQQKRIESFIIGDMVYISADYEKRMKCAQNDQGE